MTVKAIPEGYHSLTVYLGVVGAAHAIDFYRKAFDAVEEFRLDAPDGKVGHAELRIGDTRLMISEPCPDGPFSGLDSSGKPPFGLHLYVEDVDARFQQAIDAGAEVVRPVTHQFYGDRTGTLKDPFGHLWFVATHVEDLTPEQIRSRAQEMFQSPQA
ncbi:VOC family protein [Pseudomonas sp. v388]|uniref:VOC family protein n=1 Tax=Pseudomonas sp. v388 TaxID=2479849 RepID=UPI000F77A423|nr:VOC family protein [Pseudomonas sp. v388]RRV06892.1 VOC family protein [Pseudomonas sp. v388]